MDIDKLQIGPEIDLLVAEKVMGCKDHFEDGIHWKTVNNTANGELLDDWHPSMDITSAWEVLKRLNSMGFRATISIDYDNDCESLILEAGDSNCPYKKEYDPKDGHGFTYIDSEWRDCIKFPLAVCRAALKAVERLGR